MSGPILITGSSGFLGSHLAAALRDSGEDVAEIRGRDDCDLRDPAAVRVRIKAVAPRAVVHLASVPDAAGSGQAASGAVQTVACTRNLVAALQNGRAALLVHVGSYKQYGDADLPFREAAPAMPRSPYGRAKQASETIARTYSGTVCLRLGPVYGPGQQAAGLVPTIVRGLLGHGAELLLADTSWDPLYVDDAVEAICLSLRAKAARDHVINISGGEPVEPAAVCRMIAGELGSDRSFRVVSAGEACGWPCLGDIARAQPLLGWQPKTSLETGLQLTIEHLLELLTLDGAYGREGALHGT